MRSNINVRQGDIITAQLLNELANQRVAAGIRCDGCIDCRQNPDGSIQITGNFRGCFVGVTGSGGITAYDASTDTPGTGMVTVRVKDPTTGNYVDTGLSLTVDYMSTTTGGLSSGVNVVGMYQDVDGTPTITSVDCGN